MTLPPPPDTPKPLSPVSSFVNRRSVLVPFLSVLVLLIAGAAFFAVRSIEPRGTVLATVNGEPIYAEDIDVTLSFLPESYRTPEQRQSILNQTIDQRLLTQEARRRGLTVSESVIDERVEVILNDTGHTLPELRLILAEQNMTPNQFRDIVRDQILVEQLGQQAVLSRVSVLEQEITAYYDANREEFLPPKGGARISHIVVDNDAQARDIIAALNRGESFRSLAAQYSLDKYTSADGGALGVVTPQEVLDEAFRNAALGLRENQYTKLPVKSAVGYHVILRTADLPSLPLVRSSIQATILRRKQAAAFASFLEGLRSGAHITLYAPTGVISVPARAPGSMEAFAACVGTKATLYVASWSEASQEQLALFGDAQALLTVVDCDVESTRCSADSVRKFPTWAFEDDTAGDLSLAQIAQASGCQLPAK